MELLTALGIAELKKFITVLKDIEPNMAWQPEHTYIPYSSENSREILAKLIILCEEIIAHNNDAYWREDRNKQKLRNIRQQFDGGMESFAPACFDILSTTIAKTYVSLLTTLEKTNVLSSGAKTLIEAGSFGNFNKLIAFVKHNTLHLIYLFELVAKQKLDEHSALREEHRAGAMIKAAQVLLDYIQNNKSTAELSSANIAYAKLTEYRQESDGDPETIPETLTAEQVISHYTASVSPYVTALINAKAPMIGFAGLNGETGAEGEPLGKVIGESAMCTVDNQGRFHNPFKDLEIKELKAYRLKTLAASEHALLRQAKTMSGIEINANGSFLQQLEAQFSADSYRQHVAELAEKFQTIKAELRTYKDAKKNSSFLSRSLNPTNPKKIEITENITHKIRELLRKKQDAKGRPMFFANYLAEMLITMLEQDAEHAHLVRREPNVSYGSLGGLLAKYIADLYTFMDKIDLSCSPSVFYEFFDADKKEALLESIKPGRTHQVATAVG